MQKTASRIAMYDQIIAAAAAAMESGHDKEAIAIFEPLCEERHSEAMAMLGAIYQTSAANSADSECAVLWLSRAAEKGSGIAAHNLATLFVTGLPGVPPNLAQTKKYLQIARALGVELLPKECYE